MRTMTIGVTAIALLCSARWATAATIQATNFSSPHAGTAADPWPGSAIQSAINAAKGGDVVFVKNGVWNISTPISNNVGNFTLQGQSTDARLVYKNTGGWTLGTQTALINDVRITGLTFDASQLTSGIAVSITNCVNCAFTGNNVITGAINSQALFFLGGSGVTI